MSNPTGKGGFQERKHQINRKGNKPKSFEALRSLALSLAHETIETQQGPMTTVEVILRLMAKDPKQREVFLQYAFGKIPDNLDVNLKGQLKLIWPEDAAHE